MRIYCPFAVTSEERKAFEKIYDGKKPEVVQEELIPIWDYKGFLDYIEQHRRVDEIVFLKADNPLRIVNLPTEKEYGFLVYVQMNGRNVLVVACLAGKSRLVGEVIGKHKKLCIPGDKVVAI